MNFRCLIMCAWCDPLGYACIYDAWTLNYLTNCVGHGGRQMMRGDGLI